jgi:hypothetical protein
MKIYITMPNQKNEGIGIGFSYAFSRMNFFLKKESAVEMVNECPDHTILEVEVI